MDFKGPIGVGNIHYNFSEPVKIDVEAEVDRIKRTAASQPKEQLSAYESRYRDFAQLLSKSMKGKKSDKRDDLIEEVGQQVGLSFTTASNSRYLGRFLRERHSTDLEGTPFRKPQLTTRIGYEDRYQAFKQALDARLPTQSFLEVITPIANRFRISISSLYNPKYKGRYDREQKENA